MMNKPERLVLLAFFSAVLAAVALFAYVAPGPFADFFAWPTGGVWANVVSSAVLGIPAFYAIIRKLHRQHQEHLNTLHKQHIRLLSALLGTDPEDPHQP